MTILLTFLMGIGCGVLITVEVQDRRRQKLAEAPPQPSIEVASTTDLVIH